MAEPSQQALAWGIGELCPGGRVVALKDMHEGFGPWLLRIGKGGTEWTAVLRVASSRKGEDYVRTEAAALLGAERHGLAAPRLIAVDQEGRTAGRTASLQSVLVGDTIVSTECNERRLQSAGAHLATLHRIRIEPSARLPARRLPLEPDDFAADRRWAARYSDAPAERRGQVLEVAGSAYPGWSKNAVQQKLQSAALTPLLLHADEQINSRQRPNNLARFVHGDTWLGNIMCNATRCTGLIDWGCAGVGDPGIDVGHLRLSAALRYDQNAAEQVLAGWQQEAGRTFETIAYWDVVAALNTRADLAAATGRRDAFLKNALDRLVR